MDVFLDYAQIDVIYLDFSKGFNRVNNKDLLNILMRSGFGEKLLTWFELYLSNRRFIKIQKIRSCVTNILSGALQEVITFLLCFFLLFINNVKDVVKETKRLLFVDTMKLFIGVKNVTDC